MISQFLRTLAITAAIAVIVGAIFAFAPASTSPSGAPPQGRGGAPGQPRPEGRTGQPQTLLSNMLFSSGQVLIHFAATSVIIALVVVADRAISKSRKRNAADDALDAELANL